MRFVMFYHSLVSDWNHGNAHFLRGVAGELISRGHRALVYEPEGGWSYQNLVREGGELALRQFRKVYPQLEGRNYRLEGLDLDRELDGADVVIAHEWNEHELVARLSRHHEKRGGYRLLFHDTHHRSVTDRGATATFDLSGFDGVLAYGASIMDIYLHSGWAHRAWVWHEAADVRVFQPRPGRPEGDLVWIGNWGDEERSEEIREFFVEPVRRLGLKAAVYGVRYPETALKLLAGAGIRYGGWLPNFEVPKVFGRYRATVHIPRRPYARELPGIPTIRPFEALACAIPLVSAPWQDSEGLFQAGADYLMVQDGREMESALADLLADPAGAERLAEHGRRTILERHTCRHRVDQLLDICQQIAPLGPEDAGSRPAAASRNRGAPS